MIWQRCVTAGADLKLSHSCPGEPYRASAYVFPAEWDNLSVPLGPRQDCWVHLTHDRARGITGIAMSARCAHLTGQVSPLNCVYLLAPCRENLPINCVLILSVNDPYDFFCCLIPPQPKIHELFSSVGHSCLLICCHALRTPSPRFILIITSGSMGLVTCGGGSGRH